MIQAEGQILNLWGVCRQGSKALGPGLRYVVWTQGCIKRCPGCISPESQQITPRVIMETSALATDIINNSRISGITISGGEPFLQAAALAQLLASVKELRPELNVIVFTGYLKKELAWQDAKALLSQIDVLIDGPYDQNKQSMRGLRGSLNQNIVFLTNRLIDYREELEKGSRKQEVYVGKDEIVTIGIPSNNQSVTLYKNK